MTVEIVAKVAAASTLDAINTIVGQNEESVGPLTNIGNEKAFTTLTFALGPKPPQQAVIAIDVNGTPSVPAGSTVIDTDLIFVAGQLTLCTATRPG